jgi:uncharacterized protein YbjT (DUF2867 family)
VILVTGATGQVGYRVLERLTDARADVTAMVRVEARAADLPPGVRHLVGTFDGPPAADVLAGFERIFLLSRTEEAQVELEVRFVDAVVAAGHRPWIVKIAADGFQEPDCPARFMRNHRDVAAHLDATGLPVSYVAPTLYMEQLLLGVDAIRADAAVVAPAGAARIGFVAARDVAAVAANVLTAAAPEERIYSLTGPEVLGYDDVAERVSRVFATTVDYIDQPRDQARQSYLDAGMTPWQADGQLELFEWARDGGYDYLSDDVSTVTGEAPRTIDAWLEEARAAFLGPAGAPRPRI